jgi:hypothetical protein
LSDFKQGVAVSVARCHYGMAGGSEQISHETGCAGVGALAASTPAMLVCKGETTALRVGTRPAFAFEWPVCGCEQCCSSRHAALGCGLLLWCPQGRDVWCVCSNAGGLLLAGWGNQGRSTELGRECSLSIPLSSLQGLSILCSRLFNCTLLEPPLSDAENWLSPVGRRRCPL